MKVVLEYVDSAMDLHKSVKVRGSWDNWQKDQSLLPTIHGRFMTSIVANFDVKKHAELEFKFLVDGEWKLSPLYATKCSPEVCVK